MEKKEAIEVIKKNYPHVNESGSQFETALRILIPELKESEDERIRKEMIFYFTEEIPQCSIQEHSDKMRVFISWLKKQEVERTKLELKAGSSYFCYKSRYERADNETFKKGLIYKCNKDGVLDNFVIKNPEQHFIEIKDERIAWLEKHGEQKPIIEMKSAEESLGIDSDTYNKIVDECIYGEQKPAEPNWVHHKVDLSGCSEEYCKAYYDGWNNCNQQHAQLKAEQKPAEWSEDDEKEVAILEAYIRSKDWSERHIERALGIVDELVNQAKKDLELSWEDVKKIVDLYDDVYCDFSIDGKGGKTNTEEHYQEVLKRFKDLKEEKDK